MERYSMATNHLLITFTLRLKYLPAASRHNSHVALSKAAYVQDDISRRVESKPSSGGGKSFLLYTSSRPALCVAHSASYPMGTGGKSAGALTIIDKSGSHFPVSYPETKFSEAYCQ
jgi:hypothetical protein